MWASMKFLPIFWYCYCKNMLTSVFYASILLLVKNFVITLSKFTAEPLWQCYDTISHQ